MKRTPIKRKTRIRQRRAKTRDRGDYADPAYIAFLRMLPCRVPGCHGQAEAHHLRLDANGAGLGARIKDDHRAISLCRFHHSMLHTSPWVFKLEVPSGYTEEGDVVIGWNIKAWQDAQLAAQREAWEKYKSYSTVIPF